MKHEWKKDERDLYTDVKGPAIVTIPEQRFIMIDGTGDPNGEDFGERVGVLMSLAYSIKMCHKADISNDPDHASRYAYNDYTVFPPEGVWTSSAASEEGVPPDKGSLIYTIMIRQPDFITTEMFEAAYAITEKKKPHPLLKEVRFGGIEDGICVQMLHIGSFDDEPMSFAKMDAFVKENGYERTDGVHREIYLSDARRTAPERYRTILRYRIKTGEPD
ncbi:MAG: GyrI-like domain-containing protein [Methanomassiliicoccaceae archaeon]|nr:GyrI-like domain-containing protein [Methanomassiliicoccaceae archaeon]